MQYRALLAIAAAAFLISRTSAAPAPADRMSYLDDGDVRVGVDLSIGGAITYLSRAGTDDNVVNSHDWGRQIQQSYYSGPEPFGKPHPSWRNWPWNPITSGDAYGHRGRILEHRNNGRTLYVKSTPMQWALNDVPGDCTFESWITLTDNAVHVRNRLTNQRADSRQYPAHDQELPAVYTNGRFYRLMTYDGPTPWTGAPARHVMNSGPPWTSWTATEHWAALVDRSGFGLGVVHPGVLRFIGGFHGRRGAGGPKDDPTGYIAPVRREILDRDIVYEYEYTLVLGTLDEIRSFAREHRVDPRPQYRFRRDRQHWTYVNAQDAGWPIRDHLHVILEQEDPQLLGPEAWWDAADVPKLYVRAAFHTQQRRAQLFWTTAADPRFSPDKGVTFDTRPDGRFHTYEVDLRQSAGYQGTITRLRFDPVPAGAPGDYVQVASISWKR